MKIYTFYIIVNICFLGGIMACSGKRTVDTEGHIQTVLAEQDSEVEVMKLEPTDFKHELISNGKLSSEHMVDLFFSSVETIAAIYVRNGDRVWKGQPLAILDTFRLANKAEQARAAMEQARLEWQNLVIGQGYMLQDTAHVPTDVMRMVRTKSGFDQAEVAYRLAAYEYAHATLKAPFDGMVANLFTKPFNQSATDAAFCTLVDPERLEVSFTLLENELPLVRKGDRVTIAPFAFPEQRREGHVSEINPFIDDDGMVQVKASIRDGSGLYEGMNVRVSVFRSLGKQLVVPKTAVVLRSGKKVVFTLKEGKAYWNYVQTGLENATDCVVTEGLQAGDEVIVSGNINLAHESLVKVVNKVE